MEQLDFTDYEILIYNASKMYIPIGTVCLLIGFATGNFEFLFIGYSILLFVLYLYYNLYRQIY
jgi:hypothetical protein